MSQKTQDQNQDLLKTLGYFPAIGFLTRFIIDAVTSNGMTATSSIIQNSCIILYLAYVFRVLITGESPLPKFAIFVICVLILLYVTSIVMNASYMNIINRNVIDIKSDTFWVFSEIIILYKFMSLYILKQDYTNWLLGLTGIALVHATTIADNYLTLSAKPTDEAKKPIAPIVTPIGTDWCAARDCAAMKCALAIQICPVWAKNWWWRKWPTDICRGKSPAWSNQSPGETIVLIRVLHRRASWPEGIGQWSCLASFCYWRGCIRVIWVIWVMFFISLC